MRYHALLKREARMRRFTIERLSSSLSRLKVKGSDWLAWNSPAAALAQEILPFGLSRSFEDHSMFREKLWRRSWRLNEPSRLLRNGSSKFGVSFYLVVSLLMISASFLRPSVSGLSGQIWIFFLRPGRDGKEKAPPKRGLCLNIRVREAAQCSEVRISVGGGCIWGRCGKHPAGIGSAVQRRREGKVFPVKKRWAESKQAFFLLLRTL